MSLFNNLLTNFFGNKSDRDIKEIMPFVLASNEAFEKLSNLSNDELRLKSVELQHKITEYIHEENTEVQNLKHKLDTEDIPVDEREDIYKEIDKIEVSTHHFKGNFPSHCSLQGSFVPTSKSSKQIVNSSSNWKYLLKDAKLSSNKVHIFKNNLMKKEKINHIKINIFPDGGISRFRIFGKKI